MSIFIKNICSTTVNAINSWNIFFSIENCFTFYKHIYNAKKNLKNLQQDKTRDSTLLIYYEESKVNMIVNNIYNDNNYATNLLNMIFIQVKKTKHGSYIFNTKIHLFWNK